MMWRLEHSRWKGRSNRRRPDGLVGLYLRELCSNGDNFHHVLPNLLTPSGLFSYQTVSSVVTLGFGYWKNAVHDGFSFATDKFRLANRGIIICSSAIKDIKPCFSFSRGIAVFTTGMFFLWLPRAS